MIKTAIISTVRTPIEELRLFVHYHLNIGIDEIIFFFDDPLDKGIDAFTQYKNVTTIACSTQYWDNNGGQPTCVAKRQTINVNNGAKIAESKQCNWLIHIDDDELINPIVDLKQVLATTDAEAVRFTILEAVSEQEHYEHIFIPQLFKIQASRFRIQVAKLLGCSHAIFSNKYFRGHTASKMAVRIKPEIKQYKIHNAIKYHGMLAVETSKQLQLLHFDCIDINTWMRKWEQRINGTGTNNSLGKHRKKQLTLYKETKQKGHDELVILFKELYHLPKKEKNILHFLGMLTSVKINKKLFKYTN